VLKHVEKALSVEKVLFIEHSYRGVAAYSSKNKIESKEGGRTSQKRTVFREFPQV